VSKMDNWFRNHDPRKPKDPSQLFAFKNGKPVAIVRPEDPAYILAHLPAEGTPHEEAKQIFDSLLYDHPHRFIGYASKKGAILDKWGREKEAHFQPGDAMIWRDDFELPMFMQSGHFHKEVWDGRTVMVLPRHDLKADSNTGIVLESPKPEERASIVMRPGCGLSEPDCHLPTLNRLWTGDPERHWKNGPEPQTANAPTAPDAPPAGGKPSPPASSEVKP
jgi:hypothetical protein